MSGTYDVLMCDTDQTQPDPVRTQIQLQGTTKKVLYNALLDTGASHNLVSFEAWIQLGRPSWDPTPIKVKGVNGLTSYILGVLTTQIYVYNGHMEASFLGNACKSALGNHYTRLKVDEQHKLSN